MTSRIIALSNRPFSVMLVMVVIIFLISANRAWFYHRVVDGQYWVLDFPPSVPFMWQYDKDANSQLGSTAFFPDYYQIQPHVIDRPTMQAAGWLVSQGISVFVRPILNIDAMQPMVNKGVELIRSSDLVVLYGAGEVTQEDALHFLSRYISAAAGLIIFKIMLYWVAGLMMFHLVRYYSDKNVALFSVLFLFSNGYMVNAIGTYHNYEFQVITPIVVIYFFHQLCIRYSIKKNILFSIIVGLLFMAKANYAAYVAVLLLAIFFVKDRKVLLIGIPISILFQSLPWLGWHIYLETTGSGILGFTSEPSLVGQAPLLHPYSIITGTFSLGEVNQQNSALPGDWSSLLTSEAYSSVGSATVALLQLVITKSSETLKVYGSFFGFLAAIGVFILWRRENGRVILAGLGFLFLGSLLQVLFSYPGEMWHNRFVFDPLFAIYGLASVSLFHLLCFQNSEQRKVAMVSVVLLIYLSITVLNKVKMPWVHPFDQKGFYSLNDSSPNRKEGVEQFRLFATHNQSSLVKARSCQTRRDLLSLEIECVSPSKSS